MACFLFGVVIGDCVPARQSEIELFSGNARQEINGGRFFACFFGISGPSLLLNVGS